jgi:hypothetical protein
MQRLMQLWGPTQKTQNDMKKEMIADFVVKLICSGTIAVILGWAGLKIILEY